jgi:zinc protease
LPLHAAARPGVPSPQFSQPGARIRQAFPASQAHVLVGAPFIARDHPDFFALQVGNHILGGGGFGSRLMQKIRSEKGLTYGVSSSFNPMRQVGPFVISLQTRKEQADLALETVVAELKQFVEMGPSPEELRQAQADLSQSLAGSLDSNRKWLNLIGRLARFDLPLDYVEHYPQRIDAVTAAEIKAAFGRVLHPSRMVTVIIGDPAAGAAPPAPAPETSSTSPQTH